MKYTVFLFSAIIFMGAQAHQATDGDGSLKIGKCYPSYPSEYLVVKKIDDQTYELKGNWMSPNAILKTKLITSETMNALRKMGPLNQNLKYMGTQKLPMESGFDEIFDVWEVCSDLPPMKYMNREGKEISKKEFDQINIEDKKKKVNSKTPACQKSCFNLNGKPKLGKGQTLEDCLKQACK